MAFNDLGVLNSAFNGSGEVAFGFPGYSRSVAVVVAIDGNNRIVLAGQAGFDAFAIARIWPSGLLDGGFSNDGKQTAQAGTGGSAQGVAISAGNRPVLSGYVMDGLGQSHVGTGKYNDDG